VFYSPNGTYWTVPDGVVSMNVKMVSGGPARSGATKTLLNGIVSTHDASQLYEQYRKDSIQVATFVRDVVAGQQYRFQVGEAGQTGSEGILQINGNQVDRFNAIASPISTPTPSDQHTLWRSITNGQGGRGGRGHTNGASGFEGVWMPAYPSATSIVGGVNQDPQLPYQMMAMGGTGGTGGSSVMQLVASNGLQDIYETNIANGFGGIIGTELNVSTIHGFELMSVSPLPTNRVQDVVRNEQVGLDQPDTYWDTRGWVPVGMGDRGDHGMVMIVYTPTRVTSRVQVGTQLHDNGGSGLTSYTPSIMIQSDPVLNVKEGLFVIGNQGVQGDVNGNIGFGVLPSLDAKLTLQGWMQAEGVRIKTSLEMGVTGAQVHYQRVGEEGRLSMSGDGLDVIQGGATVMQVSRSGSVGIGVEPSDDSQLEINGVLSMTKVEGEGVFPSGSVVLIGGVANIPTGWIECSREVPWTEGCPQVASPLNTRYIKKLP